MNYVISGRITSYDFAKKIIGIIPHSEFTSVLRDEGRVVKTFAVFQPIEKANSGFVIVFEGELKIKFISGALSFPVVIGNSFEFEISTSASKGLSLKIPNVKGLPANRFKLITAKSK